MSLTRKELQQSKAIFVRTSTCIQGYTSILKVLLLNLMRNEIHPRLYSSGFLMQLHQKELYQSKAMFLRSSSWIWLEMKCIQSKLHFLWFVHGIWYEVRHVCPMLYPQGCMIEPTEKYQLHSSKAIVLMTFSSIWAWNGLY